MSIKLRGLDGATEIVLPSGKVLFCNSQIGGGCSVNYDDLTRGDYITVCHDGRACVGGIAPLVQRFNSVVICSQYIADHLTSPVFAEQFYPVDECNVIRVTAGNTIVFDDLKVEVKKAEHTNRHPGATKATKPSEASRRTYKIATGKEAPPDISRDELDKLLPHPWRTPEITKTLEKLKAVGLDSETGEHLNFVFETSEHLRIYYCWAGPFEFMRHEIAEARCNVLLMSMGGDTDRAAEFAALSGAEVIIPCSGVMQESKIQQERHRMIAEALAARSKAQFLDPVPGKWYEIGVKTSAI